MSDNSQDTLQADNSQEDLLSSKLESTKIAGDDPENPIGTLEGKVM